MTALLNPRDDVAPQQFPLPKAYGWGSDVYGLWLDYNIAGVIQRFRWLAPGEFLMGSPKDEIGRGEREDPQHKVILSKGYWLADTACTQGLWQAVMGKNPSYFKTSNQHPVENVSWYDSEQFLNRVNAALGIAGWRCDLPTEAQWEYGCRAGTQSAFSWGNTLSVELANYDGNYPYADGEKDIYRQKTLAVKCFKRNAWGLWQMHGNVSEWCADGPRVYTASSVTDPFGDRLEGEYAMRGGAWFRDGHFLRAAYRYWNAPGFRDVSIGLRLVLKPQARIQGDTSVETAFQDRMIRSIGEGLRALAKKIYHPK